MPLSIELFQPNIYSYLALCGLVMGLLGLFCGGIFYFQQKGKPTSQKKKLKASIIIEPHLIIKKNNFFYDGYYKNITNPTKTPEAYPCSLWR